MNVSRNAMRDIYPTRQSRQAELIPRADPVFYGEWHPSAPLTKAQTTQFDRDGYLLLENVFTHDEVRCLQSEAKSTLHNTGLLRQETIITELGSHDVRSIFEIHQQSPLMSRLASDHRLAGVASFLLDDQVYIHQSRLNYKPGFVGKEFYWHSDFETWHAEDGMPHMRALSMSVLLTENTAYNGSLMLLPGSHHRFLSCIGETPENHYKVSLKKQDYGIPDNDNLEKLVSEFGIINSAGAPGSVLIFDCNMMHGSNSNITPLPRSNAFFVYNALSNQLIAPYSAKVPRPDFIACRNPQPIFPEIGPILNQADLICG
jgi:ectoine hydroxylase